MHVNGRPVGNGRIGYPIYNPAVMTGPKAMSFASPVENPAAACATTCTGYDFVGVQNVAMDNGQVSVQCT